jgi:hypothetical protein
MHNSNQSDQRKMRGNAAGIPKGCRARADAGQALTVLTCVLLAVAAPRPTFAMMQVAAGDPPPTAAVDDADSAMTPSVESIVVRVQKEVDEFSRLGEKVQVVLPPDFSERVRQLRQLAAKGRDDAAAAAEYHVARSQLVSTLAAAMNATLAERDSVNASMARLAQSIRAAKQQVGEQLAGAEGDVRQDRQSVALRKAELRSVAGDAGKFVAAGGTLPADVQHRVRLAEQHRQIAEQAAATAELKARLLREVDAEMRAVDADLEQRARDLERYFLWVQADRGSLDAVAEIGSAQTELADLKQVVADIRREGVGLKPMNFPWRPLLDPASEAAGPGVTPTTRPRGEGNGDDVLAIIAENAPVTGKAAAPAASEPPTRPVPASSEMLKGR